MDEFNIDFNDSNIGTSISKLKNSKKSKKVNMNKFVKKIEDDIFHENNSNENIQLQRNLMQPEYEDSIKINKNINIDNKKDNIKDVCMDYKIYIDILVYMILFYILCNKIIIDFIYNNIIYSNISYVPNININLVIRTLLFGFLIFFYQKCY